MAQQLKQLIIAIEYRPARSGFSEIALGWATIFREEMATQEDGEGLQLSVGQAMATMAPPSDAIVGLTETMSCLAR